MEILIFVFFFVVVNVVEMIIVFLIFFINEFFVFFGCGVVKVFGYVSFIWFIIRKEVVCCIVKRYC